MQIDDRTTQTHFEDSTFNKGTFIRISYSKIRGGGGGGIEVQLIKIEMLIGGCEGDARGGGREGDALVSALIVKVPEKLSCIS